MDATISLVAASIATLFAVDLWWDLRNGFRPHTAAYAAGVTMFAAATWALTYGLYSGWTPDVYRTFFLLGAALNIPCLALGSMFLVGGRRAGNVMLLLLGGFSALAITVITTEPLANPLPATGIPVGVFSSEGFGPRMLAMIGAGTGTLLLVLLAIVSMFRFWKTNRRIAVGNILIFLGVAATAAGGSLMGLLDRTDVFTGSLLGGLTLIWAGYRLSRGRRGSEKARRPLAVLVGPSTTSPNLEHNLHLIRAIEARGYEVMCPARDVEEWGEIGYSPVITFQKVFAALAQSDLLVADLMDGYGVEVAAGYARALRVPVVVTAPEGTRISRPLRGVASAEVFYHDALEITSRLADPREIEVLVTVKDD